MSLTPWKILKSHRPNHWLRIDKVELKSGKPYEAFVFEFQSWANVLALTSDNQVVLVRQYRHGVQKVMLELPGGVVDEGEDPFEGVKRELMEETGYSSPNIIEVGRIHPNPAVQQNTLYCYLALDAEKTGEQHFDESEEIEVELIPLDELIKKTQSGEFTHALNVAVLYQALNYLKRIK